jgi:hypothetical protein
MMNRCIYLFCWLCLVKARIRGGASLVGDPGTGRENLDSLRLVCPESE